MGRVDGKIQRTFYVLTKVFMNYGLHGSPQPQDITPWLFSSFQKANKAMFADWKDEYEKHDGDRTAHVECMAPAKADTHAWCQFDDGNIEIVWNISKCKVDGGTTFSPNGPRRVYVATKKEKAK